MKRTERHQLKENPVALSLSQVAEAMRQRWRIVLAVVMLVVLPGVGVGGYVYWQHQRNSEAAILLSEALLIASAPVVPPAPVEEGKDAAPPPPPRAGNYPSERARLEAAVPKFLAAAERHPTTTPAIAARYHAAAALAELGRTSEAEMQYRRVIDLAGPDIYGLMARLGLANVHVDAGRPGEAVALLQELSNAKAPQVPADAVLMQLARAYLAAGRVNEARQTFTRLVEDFPESLYVAGARLELERLKLTTGA